MKMFSNDSLMGRFFGSLGDIIIVNILFVLCCVPVVTAGASLCGMNYAFLKRRRDCHDSIIRLFFTGVQSNLRQATAACYYS